MYTLLSISQIILPNAPGQATQRRDSEAQPRAPSEPVILSLSTQGPTMSMNGEEMRCGGGCRETERAHVQANAILSLQSDDRLLSC